MYPHTIRYGSGDRRSTIRIRTGTIREEQRVSSSRLALLLTSDSSWVVAGEAGPVGVGILTGVTESSWSTTHLSNVITSIRHAHRPSAEPPSGLTTLSTAMEFRIRPRR